MNLVELETIHRKMIMNMMLLNQINSYPNIMANQMLFRFSYFALKKNMIQDQWTFCQRLLSYFQIETIVLLHCHQMYLNFH